jgi:RHS repeat-associated protein
MSSRRLALGFVAVLLSSAAYAQTSSGLDAKVQAPELKPPERASLVGQLATAVFGPADVTRGAFTLPSAFTVPQERGPALASVFPSYSLEHGISEWGAGWSSANAIVRMRVQGDLDYATDDLTGPFGRMVRGADGAWYPVGLAQHVRVVEGPDTLTAYLPDGTRMTFGGLARVVTALGTYGWHLTDVTTVTGRTARIAWTANASGRLFATSLWYGGSGTDPYRVDLAYESLALPFEDYRSRQLATLDRRVKTVTVLAKHATTGAYEERWHYDLGYQAEAFGPGFHLTSVQQVFRSGERPPPTTYAYNLSSDKLASAALVAAPKVTQLIAATAGDVLQPNRSTIFDAEDDGLADLEWAYDNRLARQTSTGFTLEALAPAADAYVYCRRAPSTSNPPRVLAQLRSGVGDESQYVVDLHPDGLGSNTYFNACNRLGQKLASQTLAGLWALGPTVRLVDVNRDHMPDIVRVEYGRYRVLPNTSTATSFSFGVPTIGTLSPAFTPDTAWVHDINGDGIPDLIARSSSSLVVWYGKGNLEFASPGRVLTLRSASGTVVSPLSAYGITFVDANRDGLTDIVLSSTSGNATSLFLNRGTDFGESVVPGLRSVDPYTSKPVVVATADGGGTEVTFSKAGQGLVVALDGPETGLMAWADDGRGTVLSFTYGRAPPAPGGRQRQSVLARVDVESSGRAPVAYDFAYATPRLHSSGKFLVGYDQVQRAAPLGIEWGQFLNDDSNSGLALSSTSRDSLVLGLERYADNVYEDAPYQGIPRKRLVRTERGWRATDGSNLSAAEVTRTTGWWGDFCAAQIVNETYSGTLTTDTQYMAPAAFAGHLACLSADVVETGTHVNASLNFRHEVAISRNGVGLVTQVSSVGGLSDVWTLQNVTYTTDWLVETVSAPGQGTTTASYDPVTRLLQHLTAPNAVVVEAVSRDPITDATTLLRTTRGLLVHEQSFAFDGQERLQSTWDNLGSGSQWNPDVRWSYAFATATAPASLSRSLLVDTTSASVREAIDLLAASGEPVAAASQIPEGWAVGSLTWRDGATGQTSSYVRPTIAAPTVAGLDYGTLFTGADQVAYATAGPFGITVDHRVALHVDVQRSVVESLSIDPASPRLVKNARENGVFDRTVAMDPGSRSLAFWDEAGTSWGHVRDALGRLREVQLPDGKRHRASYDAHARVSRVEREGIATVEYAFSSVTGLLDQKRFLSPAGSLRRILSVVRDGIGRVTQEVHGDAVTGGTKTFRYYFDGATPENPSATSAAGLLTAVVGDGYVKRFEYRVDGSIARRTLEIGTWRKIVTDLSYNEAGEPSGQAVSVFSGPTLLIASSMADAYDANGRVRGTSFRDGSTGTYSYDGDGRLASVAFPAGSVSVQYDSYTKQAVGSTQTTPIYSAATAQRMSPRGLVDSETILVGTLSLARQYGYSSQRFLTSSTDAQGSYGYAFDGSGLPTRIVENGVATDLVPSGNTLVAGSVTYVFDDLGRTIQRGDLVLTYGPDGQLARATRGSVTWTFVHDESGQRLAKLASGTPVAAYVSGAYLDASQLIEPVKVRRRTVGVLRNGRFEIVATDLRGTVLAEADGVARIASPFGRRSSHPAISAAIDYIEKGYDADLGLVRMGVRDYDPEINRFTTADPLMLESPDRCSAFAAESNLYAYARGNPLSFVDDTGAFDLPYHADILRMALNGKAGFDIDVVIRANQWQDTHQYSPFLHFDANQFKRSISYVEGELAVFRLTGDNEAFGKASHPIADFFAHSNFVDLYVDYQRTLTNDPDRISLGYLRMPGFSEVFDPGNPNYGEHHGFRDYLKQTGAKITSGTFEPSKDLGDRNKDPRSHSIMHKDHPFANDPLRDLKFRLAEQGAVRETEHAADFGRAFEGWKFAPLKEEPE